MTQKLYHWMSTGVLSLAVCVICWILSPNQIIFLQNICTAFYGLLFWEGNQLYKTYPLIQSFLIFYAWNLEQCLVKPPEIKSVIF